MTMPRIIVIVLAAIVGACAARGGEIALRAGSSAPHDAPVVLGDVADLRGDEAATLRDVVLVPNPAAAAFGRAWIEIDAAHVRRALDDRGVNWGRIALTGSVCTVRLTRESPPEEAPSVEPPRFDRAPKPIEPPGATPLVRDSVVEALLRLFDVSPEDLRIGFDAADDALLDTVLWGRRVDVQPGAGGGSSRIPLAVWVYEGERVVSSATIRADVLLRRDVVIAPGGVRRGADITPDDVIAERVWLAPGGAAPIGSLEGAVGARARTRIAPGMILRTDMIETPVVVRKGDLVTVHCVSGGVLVRTPARAQADGREGELIEFRIDRTRRPFLARVSGPGVAVMLAGDEAREQDQAGDGA